MNPRWECLVATPSAKVGIPAWSLVKYSSRNPLSMQSTLLSPSAFEKFLQISIKIKYGLLEHVILFLCPLVNFFCENNTIEVMTQLYKFR